jgi:pyruvate formate lyase activating enzyme
MSPDDVIRSARSYRCSGIAFTYSEPAIWAEYVIDVASRYDGDRILVSNGYVNKKPLRDMAEHLDAANIDVKGREGFYERLCHAPFHDSLSSIALLHEVGVHVEATTLVIPGENDSDDELTAIFGGLASISTEIPLHISRFFPHYRMGSTPPTPPQTLDHAVQLAHEAGLAYVYLGNIAADDNTYCPACGTLLVGRQGYSIGHVGIAGGSCPSCGRGIYGRWQTIKK